MIADLESLESIQLLNIASATLAPTFFVIVALAESEFGRKADTSLFHSSSEGRPVSVPRKRTRAH